MTAAVGGIWALYGMLRAGNFRRLTLYVPVSYCIRFGGPVIFAAV